MRVSTVCFDFLLTNVLSILTRRNVIAMHCKGGKGRTGTAVCAHLVQHWKLTADQALLAYENARTTGWSTGSTDSQGVTGQSQIRYVKYYERILHEGR